MSDPNSILTNRQKNVCEYSATFGVLLTLTCLIQHLIIAIPGPVYILMFFGYVFAIISFLLLGFQIHFSVFLLIVSAAISLMIEFLWMANFAFSLVVLLLFLYHGVIVVVVFVEGIPKKLRMKRAAAKAERDLWAGKI